MQQYSTSVILENLQNDEKQLQDFLRHSDGSKKYVEAKYKLEVVQKELQRIKFNIDNSIGTNKMVKRDDKINVTSEKIGKTNEYADILKINQTESESKIVKKIYQWKIDNVNKKIAKLNKKMGKAQAKQRKCVNKKYINECKKRNKLAKKEAKQHFYKTLKSDLARLSLGLKTNTIKGKAESFLASNVISFSDRRAGILQSKIDKINAKNKGIRIANESVNVNNLFRVLSPQEIIYNMDHQQLKDYENKINELLANGAFNGAIDLYNIQLQTIREQQENLDNDTISVGRSM